MEILNIANEQKKDFFIDNMKVTINRASIDYNDYYGDYIISIDLSVNDRKTKFRESISLECGNFHTGNGSLQCEEGSIDLCALFRDKCGKDVELTRYSEAGLLKPAEECLKKRIILFLKNSETGLLKPAEECLKKRKIKWKK
jgi:hypothetical protein